MPLLNNRTLLITAQSPTSGFERIVRPLRSSPWEIRITKASEPSNDTPVGLSPEESRLLAQSRQTKHLINKLADSI